MKVSIILPSLNVRSYIEECIESAINQSLEDIEIICVDAGSTDGTFEILKEYEQRDPRIRVIKSDRKSYGYQMNVGIDAATGEYIGILETDDYVPKEMYEELYEIASSKNLDFVKADFYRFTGTGENLSKAHYRLSVYPEIYNRVIDIKHYQKSFAFIMNTWSGIYKREFLVKNHIKHNETLGASYQDNGFWFQTFMYAKKAYFVDKPYYMNRRDNMNSSVHSKGKVFCICDEYQFIYDIMSRDEELLEQFGNSFAFALFQAYKGNLNRIGDEYKKEFLIKWAEDLRFLVEKDLIDYERFCETDQRMLLGIADNPESYYENKLQQEEAFYNEVRGKKNIIIYGAGVIGRQVFDRLMYCSKPADVKCFAVTKKEENFDSYRGVPIYGIHELQDYQEDGLVIIGTTARYQDEIAATLSKLGFLHVVTLPEIVI